jgi:bla regulator protein BlaR1
LYYPQHGRADSRACDEAVLTQGNRPRDYADAILNVCKLYVESPLACISGVTGSNLRKRIETILTNRHALKLTFAKKAALVATGTLALAMPVMIGMTNAPLIRAQAKLETFEVASVRPNLGNDRRMHIEPRNGGKLTARNVALSWLIQYAYHIPWNQISGGAGWLDTSRFDVIAEAEDPAVTEDHLRRMTQTLLADRFNLKLHTENKELPVYALVMAKAGATGSPGLLKRAYVRRHLLSPRLIPSHAPRSG